MCGIAGILAQFQHGNEQRRRIEQMTACLQHRGPDGWGVYLAPDIAFGHTRLSILDPDHGHQPMACGDHVIAYNGEVYNYRELRDELSHEGVRFETTCDTEVVLRLFEREGPATFARLNGQFAILLWNRRNKILTVARDRFGMRPLYVLHHRGHHYFSSEMKSFDTLPDFSRDFDPHALLEHAVLWNTLGDSTVYQNIRSVASGCYETYRLGESPTIRRYHEIGENPGTDLPTSLQTATEECSALLQDAVDLRLRSDVPVGAYLSGGLDSSIIAQLTKRRKRDDFKTFSVTFEDAQFDESRYQKEVVELLDSSHRTVSISYDNIEENFMEAIYHSERPVFRTAPVPLFLLSACVGKSDIKVVLTGEGADEIFYGYDTFKELQLLDRWNRDRNSTEIPNEIKKLYPHLRHYSDPTKFGVLKMYYEDFLDDIGDELVGLNIRVNNNKILAKYLNRDLAIEFDRERLLDRLREFLPSAFGNWTLLQKNSFLEMRTLLQGYLLSSQGDRMSLGHGIEGRYPFLDHRLVDRVFHYPDQYKLRDFSEKHVLRAAFHDKIPASVASRPKRPYMAPDLISFFRNGVLTDRAQHFLSQRMIKGYGIFDARMVKRFLHKFTRREIAETGYRDNMIMTFLLSTQMAKYWALHPREYTLENPMKKVEILDSCPA